MAEETRNQVIWKFHLYSVQGWVRCPKGTEFLTCGEQSGGMCIWGHVDPKAPLVDRELHIMTTGNVKFNRELVGRLIGRIDWGGLVFHIFDPEREILP